VPAIRRTRGTESLGAAAAAAAIRPAREGEIAAVVDVLARCGFGPTVAPLVEFPRSGEHGEVLVAAADGTIVGAACCESFGATGWIGALGVAPGARKAGLGTSLTQAATEWLRGRGARTVLLFATEMGRPVYERLGFIAEGFATAWRGSAGSGPQRVALRTLREEDRPALAAADAAATGERRDAVLTALSPLAGVAAERDGELAGWAVASRWGMGVSIAAADPEAGVALMAAAARSPGSTVLIVPDRNEPGLEAVRRWGFQRANGGERMRLGPPVAWRPERQFGLFNLFWG
jgi:GNAT superfamily N-acetyltransferase